MERMWGTVRGRRGDDGRDLVLYLARRRSGRTLREIGEGRGVGGYKAVSQAVRRFEKSLPQHPARRPRVELCLAVLSHVELCPLLPA